MANRGTRRARSWHKGSFGDYAERAVTSTARFFKSSGAVIIPLTVQEILDEQIARKLA